MDFAVKTAAGGYTVRLRRGALGEAGKFFRLSRKVLIVTDDGVPEPYAAEIARQCKTAATVCVPQGESSKSPELFLRILRELAEHSFTREDCVVAVGGGVVGDLAGFAASCYMRGIDFYNVPTTLLSQIDSSVGGKTAVDYLGYKNLIGSFWQPKGVLIDPEVLKTLPPRQIVSGLGEAVKMALTGDAELFEILCRNTFEKDTEAIIEHCILYKRSVVERDEREAGLRRVLNFGHSIGHALESADTAGRYLHGECVAAGMVPMCAEPVRARLTALLKAIGLPTAVAVDPKRAKEALLHDKKRTGEQVQTVFVPKIGSAEFVEMTVEQLMKKAEKAVL